MDIYKGRIGSASDLCRFANSVVLTLAEGQRSGVGAESLGGVWDRIMDVLEPGPDWDAFSNWPESSMVFFDPQITSAMALAAQDFLHSADGGCPGDVKCNQETALSNLSRAVEKLRGSERLEDSSEELKRVEQFFRLVARRSLAEASRALEEVSAEICRGGASGD